MKRLLLALLVAAPLARAADYGAYLASHFAAAEGDYGAAAARILAALDADPGHADLRHDAFTLALLAGRPEAPQLAASLPEDPLAQLLLADARARAGDWPAAELIYAELPRQPLLETLRPLLLAWAQAAQGRADRALDTLQTAMAGGHGTVIYLLHAALIADVDHRDGLAAKLYAELARSASDQNIRLAEVLASWQARSGHPEQARATLAALAAASPEMTMALPGLIARIDRVQVADARQGIAEAYAGVAGALRREPGKMPELLLRLALAMAPDLTDAHLLAADIASAAHDDRQAAAALAAVPPSDPLAPVAALHLAALRGRLGDPDRGAAMLERLARDYPQAPEPLAALGNLLSDAGRFGGAVDAYDRALARIPHPQKADWSLFYLRGSALERAHDSGRAEADVLQALRLSPDEPFALNFLGYSWAAANRNLPEARRMIERALQLRPDDGAIVDSLGWVMLRQGDVPGAVRTLEKAAELEPVDPTITGHLGDAYWAAGRHIEAADQWRRALVLRPDIEESARIESRLKAAGLAN